jgi:hypothetical protein
MLDLNLLPSHLHPLVSLYPDYSREELEEAYENLRRYVELGWKIALRLEREGRLEDVLTKAGFNPTFKPPTNHSPQSP